MGNKFHFDMITSKKVKTVILSFIIAIVLAGFVIYLVESIYPSPDYDDYCGKFYKITNEADCVSEGGVWQEAELKSVEAVPNGYCSESRTCQEEYDREIVS